MTEQEAMNMDFWRVCEHLGIPADSYHFAKAFRQGLVTQYIWAHKYLAPNMVLTAAIDELIAKLDTLTKRGG